MTIDKLRKKINAIDAQVVDLLKQRASASKSIGQAKFLNNQEIYAPDREVEVLSRIEALNKGEIPVAALRAIYREIMSCSLSLEKPLAIATLGQTGSYTSIAAQKIFGSQVKYEPCQHIREVFQMVERGKCDYGVVPIENSTEGAVTATFDLLVDSELKIRRQATQEIVHNLLSKTTIGKIRKIYSNPQVFDQCRNWLANHLPHAGQIFVASTTEAAQIAGKEKNSAAIASREAAESSGLPIIRQGIQDIAHNTTRFLVIGANDAAPTGKDRTSILFSIKDKVGALYAMLAPFYKNKINLTKIESRPSKKKAWDYYFFVDFEGHRLDPNVQRALKELEDMCKYLKILGSYPALT